jgi:hypothetical protein
VADDVGDGELGRVDGAVDGEDQADLAGAVRPVPSMPDNQNAAIERGDSSTRIRPGRNG